jgi:uncharacterized protein (TIGR03032 family)
VEAILYTRLAAEDRSHLNGLAIEDGKAKYVTAVSQSDVADGWRDRRQDGGCVMDVTSNEVIASGLSMPHSPRVFRDKLWLLNSGSGHFSFVDRQTGKFERVAFCPGYLRGLSFHGDCMTLLDYQKLYVPKHLVLKPTKFAEC